jgi:hypothetical protein
MRNLQTLKGICEELEYRAWQERAVAAIGRTSKQRTSEAEHAARALDHLRADIRLANYRKRISLQRNENGIGFKKSDVPR